MCLFNDSFICRSFVHEILLHYHRYNYKKNIQFIQTYPSLGFNLSFKYSSGCYIFKSFFQHGTFCRVEVKFGLFVGKFFLCVKTMPICLFLTGGLFVGKAKLASGPKLYSISPLSFFKDYQDRRILISHNCVFQ